MDKKKLLTLLIGLLIVGITTYTIRIEFFPVISAFIWSVALFYTILKLVKK